ncbi:MAG: hypothetical protein QNJ72_21555 [Pleurocapsa sp. MO_226.B13]|nr:hypothetical protein [Pleurocapsa sp. MO_226.B13]
MSKVRSKILPFAGLAMLTALVIAGSSSSSSRETKSTEIILREVKASGNSVVTGERNFQW